MTNGSVHLSSDKADLAWLTRFGDLPTDESNPDEVRLAQIGLAPREEVSEDEAYMVKALHTWCVRGQALYQVSPTGYDHHMTVTG